MKLSIEDRVFQARRKLQNNLINENCSVVFNPPSEMEQDNIIPVALVKIAKKEDFSKIHKFAVELIDEYELVGCAKRDNKDDEASKFTIFLYARQPEELDKLTFRDLVDELKSIFTRNFNN